MSLYQRVLDYMGRLLPSLQRYISKRREMANQLRTPPDPLVVMDSNNSALSDRDVSFKEERSSSPSSLPSLTIPNEILHVESTSVQHNTSRTPRIPFPTPVDHGASQKTSEQMLSNIAQLADELLRASEEKVNLVQAAFDSVSPFITPVIELCIFPTERSTGISESLTKLLQNKSCPFHWVLDPIIWWIAISQSLYLDGADPCACH